jgi:hypothetical protein
VSKTLTQSGLIINQRHNGYGTLVCPEKIFSKRDQGVDKNFHQFFDNGRGIELEMIDL